MNSSESWRWNSVKSVILFSYSLIFVLASFGNCLVIFVVFRNKSMQTITNIFITNLAFSDILQTLIAVPFTPMAMYMDDWILPAILCKLLPMTMGLSVYVSTLTSTAIAVDRYIVIAYPFIPRMKMNMCVFIIILIWIIGSLITLPLAIYQNKIFDNTTNRTSCQEQWVDPKYRELFTSFNFVLQFVLPCLVISVCYYNVGKILTMRCINKIGCGVKNRLREEMEVKRKRRTNQMLIAMVTIFVICWTPLNMLWIISEILGKFEIELRHFNLTFLISHMVAMSGTIYNPFLYGWMNNNFRLEFQRVLPCLGISRQAANERLCGDENTHFKRCSEVQELSHSPAFSYRGKESSGAEELKVSPLLKVPSPNYFNGRFKVSSL